MCIIELGSVVEMEPLKGSARGVRKGGCQRQMGQIGMKEQLIMDSSYKYRGKARKSANK